MITLKQAASIAKKVKKIEDKPLDELEKDTGNLLFCFTRVERSEEGILNNCSDGSSLNYEQATELLTLFKDKQDNIKIADLSRIIICLGIFSPFLFSHLCSLFSLI